MMNSTITRTLVSVSFKTAAYIKPALIFAMPVLVVYGVFFAPMGLLHDNMHPMRHVLAMVHCH